MEIIQLVEGRETGRKITEQKERENKLSIGPDGWEGKMTVFTESLLCAGGFLKQRGGQRKGEEIQQAPDRGDREKRKKKGIFRAKTKKIGQRHRNQSPKAPSTALCNQFK